MPYKIERTQEFKDRFKELTRKDKGLNDKLSNKIKRTVQNPEIGKPKRGKLKHVRGSHVADHYVIVYTIVGNDTILFLYVDHHDFVYEKAAEIMARWEEEL